MKMAMHKDGHAVHLLATVALAGLLLCGGVSDAGPLDGLFGGKSSSGGGGGGGLSIGGFDIGKAVDASKGLVGSFESFTPEQEYYVGRGVAAEIINKFPVDPDTAATHYVNLVGQTLANVSDLPTTFSGYHFFILDTNELNALSTPSGFVFVTRGLLRVCHTEDELAAVLAHEIGHVEHHHGIQAIKNGRFWGAVKDGGMVAASRAGNANVARLASVMGDAVGEMFKTALTHGYSQDLEREADASALEIMHRVGYDGHAMVTMLTDMQDRLKQLKEADTELIATHPEAKDRIKDATKKLKNEPAVAAEPARKARFDAAIAVVLK